VTDLEELIERYRAYLNALRKYFSDYKYIKKYEKFYEGALTVLEVITNGKRRDNKGDSKKRS